MTTGTRRTDEDGPLKRSLVELVRDLANDTLALVRQEIGLLKAEIRENVRGLTGGVGKLAAGGVLVLVGLLVLVAFLVVGLGALLGGEYWLSALIVAVALLGGGAGLAYLSVRRMSKASIKPAATIETFRETAAWAGEEVRELRSGLRSGVAAREHAVTTVPSPGIGEHRRPGRRDPVTAVVTSNRPPLSLPLYKRVIQEISDDDVPGQAAKVAFYMFGSLPPALLVIFSLTGFFGGDGLGNFITRQLESSLPGSVDDPNTAAGFIGQFINDVVSEKAPGPLSIGLVLGLWASSAVFVALTDALNRAYELKDDRSWFRRRAIALAVMIGFALLFLVGSAIMLGGAAISDALGLGPAGDLAWTILQGPLALLLIVMAFFLVYYVLPDRDQSTSKMTLFKASVVAAIVWLLASFGFRIYIANFGSYGETYGFVGAILVLLLWMYVTGIAILVGGEISAEMERRPT